MSSVRVQKQKTAKLRLNQQGSSLFMVMICIAFLMILGSLMLSVSMINLRMKQVANASQNNFYKCEKALEEIQTGLEELSADTIKTTYEEVLQKYVLYSVLDDATRNRQLQDLVLSNMNTVIGSDLSDISDLFYSFLSDPTNVSGEKKYFISIGNKTSSNIVSPYTNIITFSNVKVEYLQDNYKTAITTDLKITLPSFIFSNTEDTISYSMKQVYEGYAVVADGSIISANSESNNEITGNLYSGLDIVVRDTDVNQTHSLTLNGSNMIARGSITAEDTGTLIIGSSSKPLIWADNLKTETSGSYPASSNLATTLNINGICLIKDDLTLDGRNSSAVLDGAYIGYSQAHSAKGSAVLLNGTGTSLDLARLSSLVLAGRAHVSIEDSILKPISTDPTINIMTGESLAFKSNQRAYLVPGQYIYLDDGSTVTAAGHNPLTKKDLDTAAAQINITPPANPLDVNCVPYIKDTQQYKIAVKQLVSATTSMLRYYYLNFKSGKHADQYLVDYINNYPGNLQVFDTFSLRSVKLPIANRIVSVGNVMYYDAATYPGAPIRYLQGLSGSYANDTAMDQYVSAIKLKEMNHNLIYTGTGLEEKKISELPEIYFHLSHNLTTTPGKRQYMEGDPLVASTVLRSGILQARSELGAYEVKSPDLTCLDSLLSNTWSGLAGTSKYIIVLDGDATIDAGSVFNGIFVATGNITIKAGAVVNGMVIAAGDGAASDGDIIVQEGVKINGRLIAEGDVNLGERCIINCDASTSYDPTLSVNQFLEDIFKAEGDILWKMFVNPEVTVNIIEGGSNTDLVNLSNLVTFENWRMNE